MRCFKCNKVDLIEPKSYNDLKENQMWCSQCNLIFILVENHDDSPVGSENGRGE